MKTKLNIFNFSPMLHKGWCESAKVQKCNVALLHYCRIAQSRAANHFVRFAAMFLMLMTLSVGEAWAYTANGSSVTFAKDEVITIDLTKVECTDFGADRFSCQIAKTKENGRCLYVTLTFTSSQTINSSNIGGNPQLHWRTSTDWSHNGVEWTQLGQANFPFPANSSSGNSIIVTLDGSGNTIYTWGNANLPDPAIDGCDGCYKITEE